MIEPILFWLFTKHFILDFPLQKPYQYLNKGQYGHFSGILHAGLHGLFTTLILSFWSPYAIALGILDMIVHYHIDYVKTRVNKANGWQPQYDEQFWVLLGVDQYFHYLTYLGIAMIATM